MRTKRLLGVSALILVFACSKPTGQNPPVPVVDPIKADKTSLVLDGTVNAADTVSIETGESWTVSFLPSTPTWLSLSANTGTGSKKIIVTITEANNTGSDRSTTMKVKPSSSSGQGLDITITERVNRTLSITGIAPNYGPANTLITITGTGFATTASLDTVYFNGKAAPVVSATTTKLAVRVPVGAGTGTVSVKVGNTVMNGPLFTYELSMVKTVIAGGTGWGFTDGVGTAALLALPFGLTVDSTGTIYFADYGGADIRKVSPSGVVTRIAGNPPQTGNVDGTGSAALFNGVVDVAVDASGNVFVADYFNNNIRKITPSGVVSTFKTNASLPTGIAIDPSSNLYLACPSFAGIHRIGPSGMVTELTGGYGLFDVTLDKVGNMYAVDRDNHQIKKITPAGAVTVVSGTYHVAGFQNGPASSATFNNPRSIAADDNGNLYIADVGNNAIRKIDASGNVSTVLASVSSYTFDSNYLGAYGVAVDKNGVLYVTNTSECRILKVTLQ